MIKKIEYLKDVLNNNYIGINFHADIVVSFLEKMKTLLNDEYDEYVANQQNRDTGHYHCTVISPIELDKIIKKDINNANIINKIIEDFQIEDFQILGLGSAQKEENKAYFIVCRSAQIQALRQRFEFNEKDLHITIGFKYKDVHNVPKNIILPEIDPFINELYKYYIDYDECFSFIKELDGFDYDLSKDIYCIKITNSYADFRIGNEKGIVDYLTVALLNNKLTITCKWQNSDDITYLSNTIILRKLKK